MREFKYLFKNKVLNIRNFGSILLYGQIKERILFVMFLAFDLIRRHLCDAMNVIVIELLPPVYNISKN